MNSYNNKSYRIKCNKDEAEYLKVNITQDFDFLDVLSLKITQDDVYKTYTSDYGVVVGRVLANEGFGIPNAKVSIFVPNTSNDDSIDENILYPFKTTNDKNNENIRYNLLPNSKQDTCYQNVGTFPSKTELLDNNINLEVFNKFYKFTTTTNESGDYMFFGVPVGTQQIHVDIDLSDIGVLSQAPRDMVFKGYNLKSFESPNKFKKSTNLDSLPQIITQDTTVFVYPFWGDETQDEIAISKKNINVQYKFEPTCVFLGSAFTDSLKSGISKNCRSTKYSGKMSEMMSSQGAIEMIRKTQDGAVERFDINAGRVINGDGVWCYQIPMNLDYMITDENGNLIPTDDPSIGIPTRAKVRFKVTLDGGGGQFTQSKTGTYLIPNNPKTTADEDYEFGDECKDTSFVNLFWNKVYSVKNYIPRLQTSSSSTTRNFLGIKSTNYHESNNPSPYNKIFIDLNIKFKILCLLTKLFVDIVAMINQYIITQLNYYILSDKREVGYIILDKDLYGDCSLLPSQYQDFEYFAPLLRGSNRVKREYMGLTLLTAYNKKQNDDLNRQSSGVNVNSDNGKLTIHGNVVGMNATNPIYNVKVFIGYPGEQSSYPYALFYPDYKATLFDCLETNLAESSEVVNFDFANDWLNGSLYAPRFFTKTRLNKKTGERVVKFCGSKTSYSKLRLVNTCAPSINTTTTTLIPGANTSCAKGDCYKQSGLLNTVVGNLTHVKKDDTYYYRSNFTLNDKRIYYHPTDIILLGGLSDFDNDGIPKLHQLLPTTSFKQPDNLAEESEGEVTQVPIYGVTGITFVSGYTRIETCYSSDYPEYVDGKPPIGTVGVIYEEYFITPGAPTDPSYYIWVEQPFQTYVGIEKTDYFVEQIGIVGYETAIIGASVLSSGIDWTNKSEDIRKGLFVSIGCMDSTTIVKTCVNAERLCEVGVDFDEVYDFTGYNGATIVTKEVDGFISLDEVSEGDSRGMFATLNSNNLKTTNNQYGMRKYDFKYIYPSGFDGKLSLNLPYDNSLDLTNDSNYLSSDVKHIDYNKFKFGNDSGVSFVYDTDHRLPRYENSFYFYFGLKQGSTALDIFNSRYYTTCSNDVVDYSGFLVDLKKINEESICPGSDATLEVKVSGSIVYPYNLYVNDVIYLEGVSVASVLVSGLSVGYKDIKIIDDEGVEVHGNITINTKQKLYFEIETVNSTNPVVYEPNGSLTIKDIVNYSSENNIYDVVIYFHDETASVDRINATFTGKTYTFENLGYSVDGYMVDVRENGCYDNAFVPNNVNLSSVPIVTPQAYPGERGIDVYLYDFYIKPQGSQITSSGVLFSKVGEELVNYTNPYINSEHIFNITNLMPYTDYLIRGYGVNNNGTGYTHDIIVKTFPSKPEIKTLVPYNLSESNITVGGYDILVNDETLTSKGVVISFDLYQNFTYNGATSVTLHADDVYEVIDSDMPGNIGATPHDTIHGLYLIPENTTKYDIKVYKEFELRCIVPSFLSYTEDTWLPLMDSSVTIETPFFVNNVEDSFTLNYKYLYIPINSNGFAYVVDEVGSTIRSKFNNTNTYLGVNLITDEYVYLARVKVNNIFFNFSGGFTVFFERDPLILFEIKESAENEIIIVSDDYTSNNFEMNITPPQNNSTFYVKAFASNSAGRAYGENIEVNMPV